MLGIIPKYKSDINRALYQISPANIVGQFLAFTIDINNVGSILNDYYAFSIGDTENTLFKEKKFKLDEATLGQTALRFVRGESPKMVVGYKEVQIAGFPKYKFITLDVEKARNYFNANYGKMSIADIVSHLNSIKNTLVQTSFFTTDMLPKSVVVKELTMPKQAKNLVSNSEGYPSYIENNSLSSSPIYSQTQQEKVLLVDKEFWSQLSYLRSFEDSSSAINFTWGYADVDLNPDYIPSIRIEIKYLFKPRTFNNLTSVNDFWANIVNNYDRTENKSKFMPSPQSLGNGMTSFDGENIYVGNFLKDSGKPIIGMFEGYDSAKQETTYYLPSFQTEFTQSIYNISKSEVKATIKIEKYKSKSKILLKYPDTNSFNKATGVDRVIDLQKSSATKNIVGTKDEQFANSLSLIDSSKVQFLSNKNPKFKEAFDLAIAEIYKTFIASPTSTDPKLKKQFYFNSGRDNTSPFTIYVPRNSNPTIDNPFGKNIFSSSEIPKLQQLFDGSKANILNTQINNDNYPKYCYFDLEKSYLYFENEPPVYCGQQFLSIIRVRDYSAGNYIIEVHIGELEFRYSEETIDAERILSYFFDNLVEFSLKGAITINTLLTCAEGKKEDMLEYFQKQVKFLIDHDLILSKEKLLEMQSVINTYKVVGINRLFDKYFFFKQDKSLRVFTENDVTNVLGELIDLCCENNPDLNEHFNPTIVINAEPVVEPMIEEPQIITTEPQVVEDDDFADIFAENNEVNQKLQELQQLRQEVAGQDNLIDNLDL
jgi:hypothetical protein